MLQFKEEEWLTLCSHFSWAGKFYNAITVLRVVKSDAVLGLSMNDRELHHMRTMGSVRMPIQASLFNRKCLA